MKALDVVGHTYGRLTVVANAENLGRRRRVLCCCTCGGEALVIVENLRSGHTKSCGCLQDEARQTTRNTTHGHSTGGKASPTYVSWMRMRRRCEYEKTPGYERYGGRGITVCDRWQDFENFLADMGERPAGHTLDRIDNDGDYEPGNCRWATPKEQALNRSQAGLTEKQYLTYTFAVLGFSAPEIAERVNVSQSYVYDAIGLIRKKGYAINLAKASRKKAAA